MRKVFIGSILGFLYVTSAIASPSEVMDDCLEDCTALFTPCTFRELPAMYAQCFAPEALLDAQQKLLCDVSVANHSALCSNLVTSCTLRCFADTL